MHTNLLKMATKVLLTSGIIFFLACSNTAYKEDIVVAHTGINEAFQAVEATGSDIDLEQNTLSKSLPKHLKIIKSASAKYKVKDVKKATKAIKIRANKYNAYISDLRFDNNLYQKQNRFTIKVPAEYFDIMMDSIGYLAEFIDYENITTEDVTSEYIDIEARLKTKLEVKERIETILRKNAKTVKDILATEDKLRIIQEEIETAQGRLKYLTNRISYSTIQVDLYETVAYKEEPTSYTITFWTKTKNGLSFGWNIVESTILGLTYVWPLLIIGVLVFVILKKRKTRKQ